MLHVAHSAIKTRSYRVTLFSLRYVHEQLICLSVCLSVCMWIACPKQFHGTPKTI